MPDLQRIIEIVFQGTDQLGGSVSSVGRSLDTVASKAQDITGPLAGVADTVAKADLAVAGLGAAFLGFAFNASVEFESSLTDLQKVLSESDGSVEQFIPLISELATTYGVAATNIIDAAANFKQSGFTIHEALDLTDIALKAVKISELEADGASRLLIATLRGFGVEASEAGRLLDILNGVSNEFGASAVELGQGMADISPIARTAGLSFEETAGLLTPLIEIFGSGAESANGLKTSLLRLGSDTKGVTDALADIGVSQRDANGELRLSRDIIKDLAEVWPDLSDAQKSYYAAELAGINQAAKLQAVLSNYGRVLDATEVSLGSASSAQKELEIRLASAEQAISSANVKFTEFLRVVGDQYRTEMAGAIGATGTLANAFGDLVESGALAPLFEQLRPLLTQVQNDLLAIADALPEAFKDFDLGPLTAGFDAIGASVSALFSGADITTADGLRSVLRDLTNIGGGFLQVTAGLIEGITPAIRALADMGAGFGDLSPQTQNAAGEFLGFIKVADSLLKLVGPVSGGLETIGYGIQALAGASIVKTLTTTTEGVGALATKLGAAAAFAGTWVFAFQEMSAAMDEYNSRNAAYQSAVDGLVGVEQRRASTLEEISKKLGIAIPNMAEFNRLADQGKIVFDDASGSWQRATDAVEKHGEAQLLTADEIAKAVELERELDAAIRQETENIAKADEATRSHAQSTKEAAEYTIQIIDGVKTYTQVITGKTKATSKDIEETQKAAEASEEYRLELEKLASNERIKLIEAKITLDTAELEAGTAITLAAYESINNTIASTGELLGDLFGALNDADSIRDKFTIEEQIEKENKLREEAAELQGDLTREQIRYLRERAEALAQGESLIKIEGDGLEPELEAFMWAILERIQVKATQEGADFLLGVA